MVQCSCLPLRKGTNPVVATQRYAAAEDLVEKPFNTGFESQNCRSIEEEYVCVYACVSMCASSLSLYFYVNKKVVYAPLISYPPLYLSVSLQRTSSPARRVESGFEARGTCRPIWCTIAAGGKESRRQSWRTTTPDPIRPPVSAPSHSATRVSLEHGPWKCTWAHHTVVSDIMYEGHRIFLTAEMDTFNHF